jgi:hypothetical protein
MKNLFRILIVATLAAALSAAPAHAHGDKHDHAPRHGGVVVEAGDIDLELVASPGVLRLHLRERGKPMKVDGATGKITLLSGGAKAEAALAVAGAALEAKGDFKTAGATVVAVVTLPGKAPATARFKLK